MKAFYLLLLILMSSFVIAEADIYYKKNMIIDFKVPCVNNGVACSSAAKCNITVNYPNGSNMILNKAMTNKVVYHNYSIKETSKIGVYQGIVFCNDTTKGGYTDFTYEITENGLLSNDWTFMLALGIIVFILFFFAIKISNPMHIYLQYILYVFGILFAVYIPTFFMITDTRWLFYKTFMGLIIVLTAYIIIYMSYTLLDKLNLLVTRK